MLSFQGTAQQSVDPQSEVYMCVMMQVDDNWAFVVICDLTTSNNSTLAKLVTCTVNVLCPLEVEYYTGRVFIIECNLSITLKIRSFPYIFLREGSAPSDVQKSLLNSIQAVHIHPVCCISYVVMNLQVT